MIHGQLKTEINFSIHRRGNKADQIGVGTGRLQRRNCNTVFGFGNNFHAGYRGKPREYGGSLRSAGGIILTFVGQRSPSRAIDPVWTCGPATRGGCGLRAAYAQARICVGNPGRCGGRRI